MKKLKYKKGFTLVECIVAMAVLAIMSLLLMMILNITVATRNNNMSLERDIDEQVEKLVQAPTTSETIAQNIEFIQESGGTTAVIEAIPKNGDEHIKAEKVYNDGHKKEIDAIKYDFDNYDKFEQIKKGGGATPDPGDIADKVYGSANTSSVKISQQSVTDNYNSDGTPALTKTIVLRVSFSIASFDVNVDTVKSIKVALPPTATDIKVIGSSQSLALLITDNVLRVEPTTTGSISADVSFVLTDDVFDNEYKSVKYYYEGTGSGSPADLDKNASGEFKP